MNFCAQAHLYLIFKQCGTVIWYWISIQIQPCCIINDRTHTQSIFSIIFEVLRFGLTVERMLGPNPSVDDKQSQSQKWNSQTQEDHESIATRNSLYFQFWGSLTQCLKITEKVSFNIASSLKMPKMVHFDEF